MKREVVVVFEEEMWVEAVADRPVDLECHGRIEQ